MNAPPLKKQTVSVPKPNPKSTQKSTPPPKKFTYPKGFFPGTLSRSVRPKVLVVTTLGTRLDIFEFWASRMQFCKSVCVVYEPSPTSEQIALLKQKKLEHVADLEVYLEKHQEFTHCLMCQPETLFCAQTLATIYEYLMCYDNIGWADSYVYEWETAAMGYARVASRCVPALRCYARKDLKRRAAPGILLSCRKEQNLILNVKTAFSSNPFRSLISKNQLEDYVPRTARYLIRNIILGKNSVVGANSLIGKGTRIGNHVDIGHNVTIGERCQIRSGVVIGDNARIGNDVLIGANSVIGKGVQVGHAVKISPLSKVDRNRK